MPAFLDKIFRRLMLEPDLDEAVVSRMTLAKVTAKPALPRVDLDHHIAPSGRCPSEETAICPRTIEAYSYARYLGSASSVPWAL
jgi:hypothetical protein